ncbi:response regulator transcription factor [Microvirga calopogonii]|uniref:response regulator transcription factor n=1 Tax=Microvirga calopogonii TaxID=2078013 RepID=UPI000E0D4573|nr:response regulator [Microvirga calopogonii]
MTDDLLIAIVDDDESAREAIVDLVKALGFAATGFASAAALLNSENLHKMDCLIADVRMPAMGGFELHRELVGLGFPIPTILMTAYPDDRVRAQALGAGVKIYLAKPLEAEELLSCIQSAIGHSGEPGKRSPRRH